MVDIELFALHTHGDVQIGGGSLPGLGSGSEESTVRDVEVETEDDQSGGKGKLVGMLVFGLLLVAAGVVARRKVGGDDEEPETVPLAESDEMEATAD